MTIEEYEHHGERVSVISEVKGQHRKHCLCFQGCVKFTPETRDTNCQIANDIYNHCVSFGLVTPVYECGYYQKRSQEEEDYERLRFKTISLQEKIDQLEEVLHNIKTDAEMAISEEWDKSDEGFEAQISAIDAVLQTESKNG